VRSVAPDFRRLIRHGAARLARVRHGLARVGSPLVKTAQAASTGCLCAVAALLVAASVAASPRSRATALPPLPTKEMAPSDKARIAAAVTTLMTSERFEADVPGLIIGVWSPTLGVYQGVFGKADLESVTAPSVDDSFRIGGVSRTFTATVILELAGEGKLALNGQVKTYLPDLAKRYPPIGTRTVAQLLGMRSGLPEYADSIAKQFPASARRTWTADELIELAMTSGAVKPAGATTSVSTNTNYVILGELARAVTGTPIDELVRERLLKPLRLAHTVYPAADRVELPTPFTRGYVTASGSEALKDVGSSVAPGTDVTDWNPSWSNAAGMMSSTLDDLGRWGNGLLGNALLAAGLQQARLQTVPQTAQWTYGLGIVALAGGHWIGHEGAIPGWSTWVLHDLRTGMTVVTSINSCCGDVPANFTLVLLKTLYPETFVVGGGPKATTLFKLSRTTSFTPGPGWVTDRSGTSEASVVTASKDGTTMKLTDAYRLRDGQSLQAFVALLQSAERSSPQTRVTRAKPFITASGSRGFTWELDGPTRETRTWLVTNGTRIARLDGYGAPSSLTRAGAELSAMARSITMST